MSSSSSKRERNFDDDVVIIESVAPPQLKSMKMDSSITNTSNSLPSQEDDWFDILQLQLDEDYDLEETNNNNYFKSHKVSTVMINDIAKRNSGRYDYLSVTVRGRVLFDTDIKQCRNGHLRRFVLGDNSHPFNQIRLTAFNDFVTKLNEIKKGDVIEVTNIQIKRASKEFNQFDHPFEAHFLEGFSTTPKILPDTNDYPREIRFSFKKLDYITQMTQPESIDVVVRCINDTEMCRRRDRFGHPVVVRLLTLVDDSNYKIQVSFWMPVATPTPSLIGSNIIIQGLKIQIIRATGRVIINILMCSDFIVNPQMQISVALSIWWTTKGSRVNFTEIEKVEKSPVTRYYDAMNYYLSLPLPRPSQESVATAFGMCRQTFNAFLNSNQIYFRTKHYTNPKGVAEIITKYGITNSAGDRIPISKLIVGTEIRESAVKMARSRAGLAKPKLHSPSNKEEMMKKIEQHFALKKKNPSQTLKQSLLGTGLNLGAVAMTMFNAGLTKRQKQGPKQPVKVQKANELYESLLQTCRKISLSEAVSRINEEFGPPFITRNALRMHRVVQKKQKQNETSVRENS